MGQERRSTTLLGGMLFPLSFLWVISVNHRAHGKRLEEELLQQVLYPQGRPLGPHERDEFFHVEWMKLLDEQCN